MRIEEFSKAFPKRINVDQYQPIIYAALEAGHGPDGLPKVVLEDYSDHKVATRAANAIRNQSKSRKLDLKVSLPDGSNTIGVYRGKPQSRKPKATTPEPELAGARA